MTITVQHHITRVWVLPITSEESTCLPTSEPWWSPSIIAYAGPVVLEGCDSGVAVVLQ
jgi:hypothetical protein